MVDYAQRMRTFRDEQLIEIANSLPADGFAPEAVSAARSELDARNISQADLDRLDGELQESRRRIAAEPHEPLSNGAWLLFMFLGLTNIGLLAILAMLIAGKRQKVKDAIHAILVGLIMSWGLIALLFLAFDFIH
jgi:hypothetical protein